MPVVAQQAVVHSWGRWWRRRRREWVMTEPGSWAERIRVAVLEEDRRVGGVDEIILQEVRVLDEHHLEFRFVPSYLDGREATLVVDGTRRFAEDFLADGPDEAEAALEEWPIDELAWRIHLLGTREPFAAEELIRDASGRWIRSLTA
jgi:hypothetical protein